MKSEKHKEAEMLDIQLRDNNPWCRDLPPLEKCNCGGQPGIDPSMALIYCPDCGLSFEYRYNRGTIPYFTWQLNHKDKDN